VGPVDTAAVEHRALAFPFARSAVIVQSGRASNKTTATPGTACLGSPHKLHSAAHPNLSDLLKDNETRVKR